MGPQILLSFDYELFFGSRSGSIERCLILPTQKLIEVARRHGTRLSFFVDVLFLQRLSMEFRRFPRLQNQFDIICKQLVGLIEAGHDIQLHLHPHWLDSSFDGEQWRIVPTRYKLHDFNVDTIIDMVGSAKKFLSSLIGDSIFAFRAGGWCIQPFTQIISKALLAHDIWLDSTVFANGVSSDKNRWFDFSSAPVKDFWRFSIEPSQEDIEGPFVEVPISAMSVSPLLFWRMILWRKIMPQVDHQPFGDGIPMKWDKSYFFKRLSSSTTSVASVDGIKGGLLKMAFRNEQTSSGKRLFHAMGHPKALSPYSLAQLNNFLAEIKPFNSVTFQDFKHLKPQLKQKKNEGT